MAGPRNPQGSPVTADPRLAGFAERVTLAQAVAAIDAATGPLGAETVRVGEAIGRVLAADCRSAGDWPDADRAEDDGYAVRAADTEGAGDYSPIPLVPGEDAGGALVPGTARPIAWGQALPAGADAVLPYLGTQRRGAGPIEVLVPLAPGAGIVRRGAWLPAGAPAVSRGCPLRPQDVALLASIGCDRVDVVRRPVVRLVVAGSRFGEPEALAPMLRALLARDGGEVRHAASLAETVCDPGDLILAAGRSGAGPDDLAAAGIAAAGGRLELHGVALRPGGSVGLGRLEQTPLVLLPGAPLHCLAAYDVLASRAVRRLAGLAPDCAHAQIEAVLERKIVSRVGSADLVLVRMAGGRAAPLASAEGGGLAAAARADGFVLVPEPSEGYPAGATVRVRLYDGARGGA